MSWLRCAFIFTSPAFDSVAGRIDADDSLKNGMCVFTSLLEAIVGRGADVLEHLGATVDELSRSVFKGGLKQSKGPVRSTRKLREALANVGVLADRLAKARDVLLGAGRVASYADDVGREWITPSSRIRLEAVSKDVVSLSDYESRLSDKIPASLGCGARLHQHRAERPVQDPHHRSSVVGVPPTLLAGIWGMNFKNMPEPELAMGLRAVVDRDHCQRIGAAALVQASRMDRVISSRKRGGRLTRPPPCDA